MVLIKSKFPHSHLSANAPIFFPNSSVFTNLGNNFPHAVSHLNVKASIFTPNSYGIPILSSDECGRSQSCSDLDSTPPVIEIVTPNSSINVSSQSPTGNSIDQERVVLCSPTINVSNETTTELSIIDNDNAPEECLQSLRTKNADRIIIGSLNINSVRNKIGLLGNLVSERIDILLVCETKIDKSFPKAQFELNGFAEPQRLDRSVHGGGLLLYFRNGITNKPLKLVSNQIECMIRRISNKKWLIFGIYNHQKSEISSFLSALSENLCHYLPLYDNCLLYTSPSPRDRTRSRMPSSA